MIIEQSVNDLLKHSKNAFVLLTGGYGGSILCIESN